MKRELKEKIIEILERAKRNAQLVPSEKKVPYYTNQILEVIKKIENKPPLNLNEDESIGWDMATQNFRAQLQFLEKK